MSKISKLNARPRKQDPERNRRLRVGPTGIQGSPDQTMSRRGARLLLSAGRSSRPTRTKNERGVETFARLRATIEYPAHGSSGRTTRLMFQKKVWSSRTAD